ncbi:MAG TPA: hypothetical protein VGK47_07780 [Nitrososphaeraceae archaeon]
MNKKILLSAPEHLLDDSMKTLVEKWSETPTPIEILEVLDHCIHGALAAGMVVTMLQMMYKESCDKANTTHEEVVKNASWRNEQS